MFSRFCRFAAATCIMICGVAAAQSTSIVVTTHDLSGTGVGGPADEYYIPDGDLALDVTFTEVGTDPVTALRYRLSLPTGFTYTGVSGANPPNGLPLGRTGVLDFFYTTPPALPATFRISIDMPDTLSGVYTITGRGNYGINGGAVQLGDLVSNTLKADTTAPVITLLGSSRITVNCQGPVNDPGVAANDNAEGIITGRVVTSGAVNSNIPGSYNRTYAVQDRSGNVALTRTRTFVVLDNCPATGEGEGENPCATNCVGAPTTDTDGDGLTDCEESCLTGTRPDFPDSDLDGMDDKYEITYAPPLDASRNDASADGDGDGLSNLEEYLRGSRPDDANDPQLVIVVSAETGDDATGLGTRAAPWATIGRALAQAALDATEATPVRIIALGGTYQEDVTLIPFVNLSGEVLQTSGLILAPIINGSVTAADNATLSSITIDGLNEEEVLLDISGGGAGNRFTVSGVNLRRGHTAILTDGLGAADTVIEACRVSEVAIGLDIRGAIPRMRRTFFGNISTPNEADIATAVIARATTLTLPAAGSLGDTADPTVGYNQFNILTIQGPAAINERAETLKMEQNDWRTNSAEEIAAALEGPIDFEPFLAKNAAVLAAALACTVLDAATQERITDASVLLTISDFAPVTENENGVYGFPAVRDGSYQVTVSAEGLETSATSVFLRAGQLTGVVVALGEPAPPGDNGGCTGNNQQQAKLREKAGDLLVAGIALAAMVGASRFARGRR